MSEKGTDCASCFQANLKPSIGAHNSTGLSDKTNHLFCLVKNILSGMSDYQHSLEGLYDE